jgi:hypothetical protein
VGDPRPAWCTPRAAGGIRPAGVPGGAEPSRASVSPPFSPTPLSVVVFGPGRGGVSGLLAAISAELLNSQAVIFFSVLTRASAL